MPGLDTTLFESPLKTIHARRLIDALPSRIPIYKEFMSADMESWEGRRILYPVRVGRNEGFGATRERGPIAEAQSQVYVEFDIPQRYMHGRIQFTGQVLKNSRTNRGAYIRAQQSEVDGLEKDFTNDFARILFGDGRGVLALVNVAGTGTTTLTVDAPGGVAGSVNGARFLRRNMVIAILNSTGTAVTAVRKIVSISADGNSVVLDQVVSAAQAPDNGLIVRAPNLTVSDVADTAYQIEPMGMLGMVDDGTFVNNYFAINRTTYDVMRSAVIGSVGALNLDVIQQGIDVSEQLGEGRITSHWMFHATRRSYLALLVAQRQYLSTGGANKHDGGWKGNAIDPNQPPEFGGVPVRVDKYAPYNTWFGFAKEGAIKWVNTPGEWIDEDGNVLKHVPGSDLFEAYWRWFGNFSHEKPNQCFRLDGISSNIVVVHPN